MNELLKVLSDSIYDFNEYAGVKLYSEGEFYKPAKENEHNLVVPSPELIKTFDIKDGDSTYLIFLSWGNYVRVKR